MNINLELFEDKMDSYIVLSIFCGVVLVLFQEVENYEQVTEFFKLYDVLEETIETINSFEIKSVIELDKPRNLIRFCYSFVL